DLVGGVGGDAGGRVELPGRGAQAAPLGDERARWPELLDPVVCGVGYEDVVGEAGRHVEVGAGAELAVCGAHASPLGDERARGRVLLDPRVAGIGDVDVARRIGHIYVCG